MYTTSTIGPAISANENSFHWAFLAALSYPPGKDRKAAYLDDYQRDSGGRLPYWAK